MRPARLHHTALGQFALDLDSPQTHFDLLHQEQRGMVILWQRGEAAGNRWVKLRPTDPAIPDILRAREGLGDTFITPNEFDGWRAIRLLRSLRATYVDLDSQASLYDVLDLLATQRMPGPSAVLQSGRGLHLYWLLESLPPQTLPVWQRVQDALIRALAPLGADPAAKDCTRLLRLSGTRNTKNGEEVIGCVLDGHRWSLRQLAFEVLGTEGRGQRPAATIRDIRARRPNPDRTIQGSIYARWHQVFQDLLKISKHHNHAIPKGHRDKWLFLCGAALSWFTHPQGIAAEIASLGQLHTDLNPSDYQEASAPHLKRALDAAVGNKMTWQGQAVDARYRFRRQTLYDWMQPIIPAELLPSLRAIIPDGLASERRKPHDNRNRDRATEGRYATNYTKTGVRVANKEKRAQAQAMRAQGLSTRDIAAACGVGKSTVDRWCKCVP
jgi:hypothetical protein